MEKPICKYCRQNPGTKPNGVWKGFQDKDTGEYVCWHCRYAHYTAKAKTEFVGTYSEFPVMVFNTQLNLKF